MSQLWYILCYVVEIWYATYPYLNLKLLSCPWVMPGVGLKVKMYNISDVAFEKVVFEIYAYRCCCHMDKDLGTGHLCVLDTCLFSEMH